MFAGMARTSVFMKPSCWCRRAGILRAAAGILSILWAGTGTFCLPSWLWAATYTWTGAGADSNWSTPANWLEGLAPAPPGSAEDQIVFAVTAQYWPVQNVGDVRLGRLVFDGSAAGFTLLSSLGRLTFGQQADGTLPTIVQDSAAPQTIRVFYQGPRAIYLAADTIITGRGSGGLDLQAELTGPGRLIIDLPGQVQFHSNSRINSHAGTEVRRGVLSAWADSTLGVAGAPLVLDGGALYLSDSAAGSWNRPIEIRAGGGTLMVAGQKTYSGAISGPGTLLVAQGPQGGGELTLAGLNTAAGGTRIEATLRVDHDDRLGAAGTPLCLAGGTLNPIAALTINRPIIVESSGTIDSNGFFHTLGSSLSGSGTLAKTGDGTLLLSAPGDFEGTLSVRRGIVRLAHDLALRSATVELAETGSLDLSASSQPLLGGLAGPRDLYLPDLTLRVGNNGQSSTFWGDISGPGRLAKVGPGTLRLEGTNTHAQGTAVYGGWLEIAADHALGVPGVGLILDGGTLRAAQSTALARPISLGSGGGGFEAAGSEIALTITQPIGGEGGLTKTGPGTLILQADSTYIGGTTIRQGVLLVDRDAALGDPAGALFLDGGTLRCAGSLATSRALAVETRGGTLDTAGSDLEIAGPATIAGELVRSGSGSLTFSAAVALAGRLVSLGGEVVLGGSLSGAGELVQGGPGMMRLTAPSSFGGQVFVAAGALRVAHELALQNAAVQVGAGALLDFSSTPQPVVGTLSGYGTVQLDGTALLVGNSGLAGDFRGTIQGSGGLTKIGPGLLRLGGNNSYTGPTSIGSGTLSAQSDLALGAPGSPLLFDGGTLLVSGIFDTSRPVFANSAPVRIEALSMATLRGSIEGPNGLIKSGPGTLVLAASNSFAGPTRIEQGTVQLAAAGALPAGSQIELQAAGNLDLGGLDLTLSGLAGTGTIETAGGALNVDCSTPISFAGRIAGGGSLTKSGTSSLTLAGPATYTGPTTVSAGQLVVQEPLASSLLTVADGAQLRLENVVLPVSPLRTLRAESGGTIEYRASTILGGYLRGPGVHRVLPGGTSRFEGATAFASARIDQQGALELVNFSSGAQIDAKAPLIWEGGMNLASGRLIVSSTAEVADWINEGVLSIGAGGTLDNHTSNLVSAGGSRITIEPGGTLNANARAQGTSLDLQGSLVVNNGTITGTTNVYYGATLKGTGTFGNVQLFAGGKFSPGNSPGIAQIAGELVWAARGQLEFEILDAAGPAGVGHDLIRLVGAGSRLQVTAGSDPADAFCIHVVSGRADRPRPAKNFDARRAWQWLLLEGPAGGSLLETLEDASRFDAAGIAGDASGLCELSLPAAWDDSAALAFSGIVLDTTDFRNPLEGGRFGLAVQSGSLYLTFQPVPEPRSLRLLAALLACVVLPAAVGGKMRRLGARQPLGRPSGRFGRHE